MLIATLAVEENWGSTILVDEGQTIFIIDVLGAMIVATLAVEEIDGSRLLESEVDVIYSITKKSQLTYRTNSNLKLINSDKRMNREVYPSSVFFYFFTNTKF